MNSWCLGWDSSLYVVQGIWYVAEAGVNNRAAGRESDRESGGPWVSPLQECQEVSRTGQVEKIGWRHQSRDLWLLLSQAGYQNLSSVHAHAWSPTCALPRLSLFAVQAIRTSHVRQGGLQKVEKQMQFYLLPKAHRWADICPCDPDRNNDGTLVSFSWYICSVNQNRAKRIEYNTA